MSSLVAAASSSGGSGNLLIFALPLALIGWMFYTQRRRSKESQKLQSTLGIGDKVTTTSGLYGQITAIDDQIATLEVSPGVNVRFNRRAIAGPAAAAPISPIASGSGDSEADAASDPTRETD
jgi:preprotein translocase subunit YajC